ncbi:SIP domain-containing protein [Burkholderia cepacia]|uniref:hypothetical protein n=1 Tax=Burkholderia cepacia TaxID=292 RepID=UPI0038B9C4BC
MWDQVEGATEILVYCHGGGPGSEWAESIATGDEQHVLGPRRALDLVDIAESTILFGEQAVDEIGRADWCAGDCNDGALRWRVGAMGGAARNHVGRYSRCVELGRGGRAPQPGIDGLLLSATRRIACWQARSRDGCHWWCSEDRSATRSTRWCGGHRYGQQAGAGNCCEIAQSRENRGRQGCPWAL